MSTCQESDGAWTETVGTDWRQSSSKCSLSFCFFGLIHRAKAVPIRSPAIDGVARRLRAAAIDVGALTSIVAGRFPSLLPNERIKSTLEPIPTCLFVDPAHLVSLPTTLPESEDNSLQENATHTIFLVRSCYDKTQRHERHRQNGTHGAV